MMKKILYVNAGKILVHFELSSQAAEVVDASDAPEKVIQLLEKERHYIDLANFYAHALPMRESIWWASLALKQREGEWNDKEERLINDCISWVREPNEPLRRRIEVQVQPLANESAPKWLGQAVFWSGHGSIAPAENPVVMPAEFLYAKAVAGAVNTAAVLPEWNGYKNYYQKVFSLALDIAHGGTGSASGRGY